MELIHIGGIIMRHARLWMRDKNLFMIVLYWPLFDIVIWGFLGIWLQQSMGDFGTTLLLNIVLWQLVCRSSLCVFNMFIEEIMANNLSNLFSLPLRLLEWIIGAIIFASIQVGVVVVFASSLIIYAYGIPPLLILKSLLIFGPPLLLSGLTLGFLIVPIICMVGKRGQEIAYIINWFFTPFSGVFYPISVLPPIGKKISYFLPTSHVFNGVRSWLAGNAYTSYLLHAYGLAVIYLVISITAFFIMFQRAKKAGLSRLSD